MSDSLAISKHLTMPSDMANVLITGANGFVGQHLKRELRGVYDLFTPSSQDLDVLSDRWTIGSSSVRNGVETYMLTNRIEAVVHLAATCGGIGINKDNPGRFIHQNLQMGINVIEAARRARVKKVVNLGSVCSYPKFTPVPFQESELWNGYPEETNAPYGIAKRTLMAMGSAYREQYGMDVTNLVPVNMYGEHDDFDLYSSHVIPALIRKFEEPYHRQYENKDGERFAGVMMGDMPDDITPLYPFVSLWGTGSASREFMHAEDCARAIAAALEKDVGSEPINIGTGSEITILDLAEKIKTVGGYDAEIVWDDTKPDGQPRRCLDISRAKSMLRWEPRIDLDEGLERTIRWYRDNK